MPHPKFIYLPKHLEACCFWNIWKITIRSSRKFIENCMAFTINLIKVNTLFPNLFLQFPFNTEFVILLDLSWLEVVWDESKIFERIDT